ncbi:hypothetical protein PIB30_066263 [Stylosanthes scabra]|uniref:Uncharacterized protein n=1 Tax=Stylosanthes scabra TaxID=79078 RepID=A0ABU6SNT2_9FABA|nr:hypothetical protein [Stylosanthes scabra]
MAPISCPSSSTCDNRFRGSDVAVWLLILVMSFSLTHSLTKKLRLEFCGKWKESCVNDQAVKVVDIANFRLQFVTYIKRYIKLLTAKLESEKQEPFKKNIEAETKFLLSKLSDLQFFIKAKKREDCRHILVDQLMPLKKDIVDAVVAKKYYILKTWLESVVVTGEWYITGNSAMGLLSTSKLQRQSLWVRAPFSQSLSNDSI